MCREVTGDVGRYGLGMETEIGIEACSESAMVLRGNTNDLKDDLIVNHDDQQGRGRCVGSWNV